MCKYLFIVCLYKRFTIATKGAVLTAYTDYVHATFCKLLHLF